MNVDARALNRRLRTLLQPGAGLIMPGAGNALTARIIAALSAAVSKKSFNMPFTPCETASRTGAVSDAKTRHSQAIASTSDQDSVNG